MAHGRHRGGRERADDGTPVTYEDEYGQIIDFSVPRLAGGPRPGPWHQILFEIFGGPYRCDHPEQGCGAEGGCENAKGQGLVEIAADKGYDGQPDPRQVRRFLQPFYEEILEKTLDEAAPWRIILPGGGPPRGGQSHRRHGGGGGGRERARRDPGERRHGGGGGGRGYGQTGGRRGGGHQQSMGHGF
ncbi:MAG: hypothetical protein Q9199_007357 [Rusavskia elegans]